MQPLREVVVAVVSVVFNVCFPVFPRSVGPVLFVQDVDMSKHCVTVRRLKFLFLFETVSESRHQTNLFFYTSRFCFSRLV